MATEKRVLIICILVGLSVSMRTSPVGQLHWEESRWQWSSMEDRSVRRVLSNKGFAPGIFLLLSLIRIQLYECGKRGKESSFRITVYHSIQQLT